MPSPVVRLLRNLCNLNQVNKIAYLGYHLQETNLKATTFWNIKNRWNVGKIHWRWCAMKEDCIKRVDEYFRLFIKQ